MASKFAWLFQGVLLIGALCSYVFIGLVTNWSVVIHPPAQAEFTTVSPPKARSISSLKDWYGVELAFRPGSGVLYVANVSEPGLAIGKGVLPGDAVARGRQNGRTVFDAFASDGLPEQVLLELKRFMETPPTAVLPTCTSFDDKLSLEVDFDMEHVDVVKGDAYLPVTIIFFKGLFAAILWSLSTALINRDALRSILNPRTVRLLLVPALGWSLADVCEILANGRMNAALYSVISQSRLVGTALLMRFLLGTKRTVLELLLLSSISVIILCYCQVPDSVALGQYWNGFGKPQDPDEKQPEENDPMGIVYAFAKIFLSISMGVVGQKALQNSAVKDLPVVGLQASIAAVSSVVMLPAMLVNMWAVKWEHGLFGGAAVEFRHCQKDWNMGRCKATELVGIVEQGWDYRTCCVLAFYIFSDIICNTVLRVFDALIKNLANATAIVGTYFLSIWLLGNEFNAAKCGLIFAIVLQIVAYALAPKYQEPPKRDARELTVERDCEGTVHSAATPEPMLSNEIELQVPVTYKK